MKEAKDIMDEIHIMTRVKEQQLSVMETLVKHVRRSMAPRIRSRRVTLSRPEASWDLALGSIMDRSPYDTAAAAGPQGMESQRAAEEAGREQAKWTLNRADQLLEDVKERISELQILVRNAQYTSAAVRNCPYLF